MFEQADSQRPKGPMRNRALMLAVAGALALPGAAQAGTTASVSAVAKAGARAETQLVRAERLADQTGSSAQARARALLARSQGEIKAAVARTQALMASADSSSEVRAAARAGMRISSTLADAARLQSEIAIEGSGRLESQAAAALVGDVRMQQAVLMGTLRMAAETTDQSAQAALKTAREAVGDLAVEVQAAVRTAASSEVAGSAQASAELAVAIGSDAVRASAETVSALAADLATSAQGAVQGVRAGLTNAAALVAATIAAADIDTEQVALPGLGLVTLGPLAQLGVDATASASVSSEAQSPAGEAKTSGQASGTLGPLGNGS